MAHKFAELVDAFVCKPDCIVSWYIDYIQEMLRSCSARSHICGDEKTMMPCDVLVLACEALSMRENISDILKGRLHDVILALPSAAGEKGSIILDTMQLLQSSLLDIKHLASAYATMTSMGLQYPCCLC